MTSAKNYVRVLALALLVACLMGPVAYAQGTFYRCQIIVRQAGVSNINGGGVCPVDPSRLINGAGVALLLTLSSGASMTVSVQVTGDDPLNTSGGGNWVNHDTLVNETASASGNIQFAVTGVRLNVTSYSSGTATLTLLMPGVPK